MNDDVEDASFVEARWITGAGFEAIVVVCQGSWRNGYVRVPEGHPLYGVEYNQPHEAIIPVSDDEPVDDRGLIPWLAVAADPSLRTSLEVAIDVHGGVTFSGTPVSEKEGWWFGFDCAHYGDGFIEGSSMARQASFDHGPVRSKEYVKEHCERLAAQLVTRVRFK